MKFICVDHSIKPAPVWRSVTDQQRFLPNPIHRIDPTSFCCSYATAIQGEYVSLDHTALRNDETFPFQEMLQLPFRVLTKSWTQELPEAFEQCDAILIAYEQQRKKEIYSLLGRLRNSHPHVIVIGTLGSLQTRRRKHWENDRRSLDDLRRFYDSCDAILSVVRAAVPYHQSITHTPIVYIPQPYPVHHAHRLWKMFSEKDKCIFVAGSTNYSQPTSTYAAAREIQYRHPDITIHVATESLSPERLRFVKDLRYETMSPLPWRDFLPYIAQMQLVLNHEQWWMRGLFQADCAAVGTPSVGGASDGQQELFPELAVRNMEDAKTLAELSLHLLSDVSFYESVVLRARRRLESYGFQQTEARFRKLVQYIREDRVHEYPTFIWKQNTLVEKDPSLYATSAPHYNRVSNKE